MPDSGYCIDNFTIQANSRAVCLLLSLIAKLTQAYIIYKQCKNGSCCPLLRHIYIYIIKRMKRHYEEAKYILHRGNILAAINR